MSTYTEEQNKFIDYNEDASIILSATAGSGKTHSTVGRLNKMIDNGIDPTRMIFFSFTNDAVNELKSRVQHNVRILTIHSFTSSILGKMGKYKPVATFYEFTGWFRDKFKPNIKDPIKIKEDYANTMDKFYEEGAQISSTFSAFKLQSADGIKCEKPKYFDAYREFLNESQSRDFSDMLIETERYSRDPKYKKYFEGTYDYVFVDEYQDTSTLQMKILLTIKAKQYHLIGDKNQSIYGFSGANCDAIEDLLKNDHPVIEMTLTKNFRSHKSIVENSNKFSTLRAIPHHEDEGYINRELIDEKEMYHMLQDEKPLTILARTNNVIKEIEKQALKRKIKMRYFNYITPSDVEKINDGKINPSLKKRLESITPYYGNTTGLLKFIKENETSDTFITTIHKSKGREFKRCIIVNSVEPEMLGDTNYDCDKYSFLTSQGLIDMEARNVHYVAVTRPIEEMYYLIYEE